MSTHRLRALKRQARAAGWKEPWTKADEDALLKGCYYSAEEAERPIIFIEKYCRQSKGKWGGQPIILLEWQKKLLRRIFGWLRKNHTRRYRRVYVEISKKNGKSTLAAALELYMLIGDGEPGAEVYTAATTRGQAAIIHKEASSMARKSPELMKLITSIVDNTKTISVGKDSWIRALASEADSNEGWNTSALIIDEYHAWKDRKFFDTIQYSGIARSEPLLFIITTAGSDKDSMCGEMHDYARQVISGEVLDFAFHGEIYGNDLDADITDPKVWRKANPSMGVIFQEEDFLEELTRARASERDLAAFKRYRLGIWIQSSQAWMPMEHWKRCPPSPDLELKGRPCWSGLDLAATTDIAALVHLFPLVEEVKNEQGILEEVLFVDVLCRFWVPEQKVREVTERNLARYQEWVDAGFIKATPGEVIDYDWIMHTIDEDAQQFDIKELAFDRWGATQIATRLDELGMVVFPMGQGFKSLSPPSKELYKMVMQGRVRHNHNPVLTWMAGNVVVQEDAAGNIKPIKNPRDGGKHKKIDGIVALIMALDRVVQPGEEPSSYEDEGLLVL